MKADIISYIRNEINEESINLTLIQKELDDIRIRFPLDNIPNMKIEDWVTVGDKYCFINMIENKTTSIASGFLGFNRNRLFYQGKNDPKPLIIKAISGEKRFDGLNDELQKLFEELKKEKQSFEELGITYDEKAFYDILVAVAEKNKFKDKYEDSKLIEIAKEIKKLVSNKSKYTDWTNRTDIKDKLYSDVISLLYSKGFPPMPCDEAYDEIMKQVENFKKYRE